MSTFNGLVAEFPDIRIDFFRSHAGRLPPLACFLSHIHSDHLAGLETLRSPFVYCSAATREMLLRLERYPCRLNYAKGILEARVQTYKHLKNLLKPLPLETTTTLELAPGIHIQVTLFDANHCPGAVMFLIEDSNRAILYTGDIRSEPWFVNSIARNPAVIEYTSGLKTLDKIYLDTSFIRDVPFQTKAEGIAELLRKVASYPTDTIFHIQAWTYGYEQVWIALSKALKSRIHVDDYKMRMFSSLTGKTSNDRFGSSVHLCPEAPALAGYVCGNTPHPGCLTRDEHVRLHSCERGAFCSVVQNARVVSILPVVAHLQNGADVAEAGVGGGGDDLERDAELDPLSAQDIKTMVKLMDETPEIPTDAKMRLLQLMEAGAISGRNMRLDLDMTSFGEKNETAILDAFRTIAQRKQSANEQVVGFSDDSAELPRVITFPYSRHSSYRELCDLVRAFRPKDVWPCTVNIPEWLGGNVTIKSLFGPECSGDIFAHDLEMEKVARERADVLQHQASQDFDANHSSTSQSHQADEASCANAGVGLPTAKLNTAPSAPQQPHWEPQTPNYTGREARETQGPSASGTFTRNAHPLVVTSRIRSDAYLNMVRNVLGGEWTPIGLLSTLDHHTVPDKDLGMV
ncbi:artemis protein [Colletotrichum graminicola]|uniref:Protein artemis n=1 Tax=Colletotrichum graminicola (strain M1.001 / M2 / FGSC 10212) TaxID=645133 RepID=E3QXB5_COLGM|nr:artemis protein [Colletotrichum graminicola M1.001]EFQ35503.1 artemis protein [Colletotrichum graminicola M1.001]WDK08752.1 artemis protein [Colletotrichum graminicola]